MEEYITKNQAIYAMEQVTQPECFIEDTQKDFAKIIEKLPAADVAPVVRGKWKKLTCYDENLNADFQCSNCLAGDTHARGVEVPYCWKCGARMDGEENG